PFDTGSMWSTCKTTSGAFEPQYWHVNRSLLKTSKRSFFPIACLVTVSTPSPAPRSRAAKPQSLPRAGTAPGSRPASRRNAKPPPAGAAQARRGRGSLSGTGHRQGWPPPCPWYVRSSAPHLEVTTALPTRGGLPALPCLGLRPLVPGQESKSVLLSPLRNAEQVDRDLRPVAVWVRFHGREAHADDLWATW